MKALFKNWRNYLNESYLPIADDFMIKKIIKAVLSVTEVRYQPGLEYRSLFDQALDLAVKDGILDRNPNHYNRVEADAAFERIKKHGIRYALSESVKVAIEKTKSTGCPSATQDLELNTKNRDAAVQAEHIQYGPLNVDEPGNYWKDIATAWNTSEEAAKKSLCGNCVAFDISPRMKECMPGETSDQDGELGYCWMHHFKCHSARSCRTWAKGGPINDDNKSKEWQDKNETSI
jgi:hypothetical protein